jgi:hypothetical protein
MTQCCMTRGIVSFTVYSSVTVVLHYCLASYQIPRSNGRVRCPQNGKMRGLKFHA